MGLCSQGQILAPVSADDWTSVGLFRLYKNENDCNSELFGALKLSMKCEVLCKVPGTHGFSMYVCQMPFSMFLMWPVFFFSFKLWCGKWPFPRSEPAGSPGQLFLWAGASCHLSRAQPAQRVLSLQIRQWLWLVTKGNVEKLFTSKRAVSTSCLAPSFTLTSTLTPSHQSSGTVPL